MNQIKVSKSNYEVTVELVTTVVAFAVSYYALHPEELEALKVKKNRYIEACRNLAEIARTWLGIRDLPEIP